MQLKLKRKQLKKIIKYEVLMLLNAKKDSYKFKEKS